jgi:histidyl-tRNA synthetase
MENQNCKGMQDLLPVDMSSFRYIEDIFLDCCHKYGYQEVRTPTLEYLHLFTAIGTLTPNTLNKVYSFLDWDGWSGERVVLRPDGTIPVARLYIDNMSQLNTVKLCYVTNIFAYEATGNESRERWQFGAEFIGGNRLAADAEIISLANNITHSLGIKNINLQLSHAGLIKALVKELAFNPAEETSLVDHVLDGDWQALLERGEVEEMGKLLALLLNLKGKSNRFLQNVKTLYPQASPELKSNIDDFINITKLLDDLNCEYEIDMKAIRNFEYYTGVCFQLSANGRRIGGGGRYDDLIPLMRGGDHLACGFAIYVDSIMKSTCVDKKEGGDRAILVKGENTTPEIIEDCFTLAQNLRVEDYSVDIHFTERELSDYFWIISVCGETPTSYDIFNQKRQQHYSAASINEVMKVLHQ